MELTSHYVMAVCLCVMTAGTARETWRSVHYPEDWTPQSTAADGSFLHDVSYAGYHHGTAAPPTEADTRINVVVDFHADPTGKIDALPAIQAAIDAAAGDRKRTIVYLPEGTYRCDGELLIKTSHTVLRGAGPTATRLRFTTVPKRGRSNHIQLSGSVRAGADTPLASDAASRAFHIDVQDAGDLRPGDHIRIGWTITPEFVREHQMTGTWKSFNGKWRPFFLRQIRRIDRQRIPHRVFFDVPLRYPAKRRDAASVQCVRGAISECGIEDLALCNAVDRKAAWSRAGVHAIGLLNARDCWVRNVHSYPSELPEHKGHHLQGGGIIVGDCKSVTIADCRMEKAQNRGGGGAGYLFEITRSNEILTHDCTAIAGRHNFIQNWDFGASGLVWLRCTSRAGRGYNSIVDTTGSPGLCEFHHSLAMACLIDSCILDDGWFGGNRHGWSAGAGATVTQSVYWNTSGKGVLRSWQAGHGHVIGTRDIEVETSLKSRFAEGTAPEDIREGIGAGAGLLPRSLYDDQLRRRLRREAARCEG